MFRKLLGINELMFYLIAFFLLLIPFLLSVDDVQSCLRKVQTLKYAEEACYNGILIIKAFSSGLEVGSCNWTINSPKRNITCISGSIFVSPHAMDFDFHALRGNDLILYSDFSPLYTSEDLECGSNCSIAITNNFSTLRYALCIYC